MLAAGESTDLLLTGTAAVIEPLGPETFVHVDMGNSLLLASASAKAPPALGQRVRIGASTTALTLFDAATERAL